MSTLGFTLMFAVWLMFGVLGIPIREEFGLSDVQTGVARSRSPSSTAPSGDCPPASPPIASAASGSSSPCWPSRPSRPISCRRRRRTRCCSSTPSSSASPATPSASASPGSAPGGRRAARASRSASSAPATWAPRVTKFIGPALIAAVPVAGYLGGFVPGGWRFVPFLYMVLLIAMAVATWLWTPHREIKPGGGRSLTSMLLPLKQARVWRFSLYYVVVFGAYVALAAWLPKYYVDVYDMPLSQAALLTARLHLPRVAAAPGRRLDVGHHRRPQGHVHLLHDHARRLRHPDDAVRPHRPQQPRRQHAARSCRGRSAPSCSPSWSS